MTEAPLPPQLPDDRYVVIRLLGRGGMAAVWLARDVKHDRLVAVKVLDAELSQSVGAERFQREIAIAAKLRHPNILPLHDSGQAGGALYYVMPFIEGESLRERLESERQLPVDEAMRLTCEIASALDYAHRHQILHRDIKPENILLQDGHAIVADFGIARAIGSATDARMTATGLALGTPAYMSPEQATAEPVIDARSDVYSLASVLYEMLAGEPPFTGPTVQSIIAKRLGGPPPRIRTVRPSVPESLERVLLRALDPVPADRTASAAQFRDALAACPALEASRSARAMRRRIATVAAAVGIIAIGAAGWTLHDQRSQRGAITTIAVLPLSNASPDPEHAYLAEGLTNALIEDLLSRPGMRVVGRMSAMQFASGMGMEMGGGMDGAPMRMSGSMAFMDEPGGDEPMQADTGMGMRRRGGGGLEAIARELRADVLLVGTLSREGDSVRVSASLQRASPSVVPVWEREYARHVRDLFSLQRQLALDVVVAVVGTHQAAGAAPADASRTFEPAAHDAYLKGSYYQAHWKLEEAIASFAQAVQLDPTHAPAQAGLARAYYFRAFFGDIAPGIAFSHMRRAATAALEQDSTLAEAHAQLALVKMLQDWDWKGAERHFARALEISPDHAQIRHDYAHFLLAQGRRRESAEQTELAVAADPINPMLISCRGWHSLFNAEYDEATRFAAEANAMMPDDWAYIVLGWARLGQGDGEAALAAFREAVRLNPSAFTLAALGHALGVAGRDDEAREVLASLLERVEREYVSPYDIATVYAGLRDADGTFRWLRRAAEERSTFVVHVGWDSRFDPVRSDPRLAELTDREMQIPQPQFAVMRAEERRRM